MFQKSSISKDKDKEEKEKEKEKDYESQKKNKELSVEGFDTGSDALNKVEDKLAESVKTMRDDLILFAKWSVINVFVVWIIWRVGSHVIWYNSIPRVLLKTIYPPGYDYLKQILNENMGDSKCTDVMHSGGMVQEKAEYEPDQLEIFNERKSCCPGLELPIAEGDDMDVPCWPLHTSHSTVKNLNKQNYLYKVWNDDYTDCVSYVTWKAEADQEAAQAESQAVQAEIQLEKARQRESQTAGGMSGGLGSNSDLNALMDANNGKLTAEHLRRMGLGGLLTNLDGSPLTPEANQAMLERLSGAAGNIRGKTWSDITAGITREQAMANYNSHDETQAEALRDASQMEAQEIMDAEQAQLTNNQRFDTNKNEFIKAKDDMKARYEASNTRYNAQITAMQNAIDNFKEGEIDLSKFQNKGLEREAENKSADVQGQQQITQMPGMGVPGMMMQDRANVANKDREKEVTVVSREFENIASFRKQPVAQQEQIIENLNKQLAKTQINQEKQRIKAKLDELKKEMRIKQADQLKAVQTSKKEMQNQYKLEEKHSKTMAKLQMDLTKKQRDNMMKRMKRMLKVQEKNRQRQVRFNQKIAEHEKDRDAKKFEEELKKRGADLLKMEEEEAKIDAKTTKDKFESYASSGLGMLQKAAVMFKDGVVWLCKSLFNIITTLLKWSGGCSWDQGLRGVITGPNTLTSLSTSFILAIKASISWLIYSCITASGGNILISFLFATIFLALGTALVNIVWISPLSTIWTFFEFKWPQPMMFASFFLFLPLSVIYGLIFGILYIFYSWAHVIEFHFNCLFSSKGDKFKSQLKGCSNIQATLRRLFFILTIINAVQTLDPKVVTGIILCFLYIEYKKMK